MAKPQRVQTDPEPKAAALEFQTQTSAPFRSEIEGAVLFLGPGVYLASPT